MNENCCCLVIKSMQGWVKKDNCHFFPLIPYQVMMKATKQSSSSESRRCFCPILFFTATMVAGIPEKMSGPTNWALVLKKKKKGVLGAQDHTPSYPVKGCIHVHSQAPHSSENSTGCLRPELFHKRHDSKVHEQKMAELQKDRTTPELPPLTDVGVLCFGP